MDILLIYKGKRYIIETKVNRQVNITAFIQAGIKQVTQKYLAAESVDEGYLVIFDTRTEVGSVCEPQVYPEGNKSVTVFTIGIGYPSDMGQ